MNSRWRDEGARPAPPLHHPLAFEIGQSVPRRHQAHTVNLGQFALRINRVSRLQLPGFYALQDSPLDSLVSRDPVSSVASHGRFLELAASISPRAIEHNTISFLHAIWQVPAGVPAFRQLYSLE